MAIIPRNEHNISRKGINVNALKVLSRLNKSGYEAYLVGGGVRDLLLGREPKDFDIATNATPEQIQKLFRNCRLVGRRFRLAHIMFGRDIIEVATFRGSHDESADSHAAKRSQSGMLLRDNVYGTIEEDAIRRDFTINAFYYSAKDFTVRDYCCGMADLKDNTIRLIGDPELRYREDPVRMLRAIRFAAKLNMTIEPETLKPIHALGHLLKNIPAPRLFDESLKLLQSGHGYASYVLLRQNNLIAPLLPLVAKLSTPEQNSYMERMIVQILKNTDARIEQDKRVNPAFLYAAILWYPLTERAQALSQESGLAYHEAFSIAANEILDEQCRATAIPKRITSIILDIWYLQLRLPKRIRKRTYSILAHPKFRAGFDLLELRAEIEKGELSALAEWWEAFQHAPQAQQDAMLKSIGTGSRTNGPRSGRSSNARKRFQHKKKSAE